MQPGEELVDEPFQRLIERGELLAAPLRGLLGADGHAQGQADARGAVRGGHAPWAVWDRTAAAPSTAATESPDAVLGAVAARLGLDRPPRLLTVLAIGAHSDDIEIGCGGDDAPARRAVPAIRSAGSCSAPPASERDGGARRARPRSSARREARRAPARSSATRFFPHDAGVKEFFEELKADLAPDLVFTHARHDLHQDHRIVCELTWNTFRDHLILEYEIPKYDGDLGSPNVFVPGRRSTSPAGRSSCSCEHFAHPARQALVHRRRLPRPDAAARRRVALADAGTRRRSTPASSGSTSPAEPPERSGGERRAGVERVQAAPRCRPRIASSPG